MNCHWQDPGPSCTINQYFIQQNGTTQMQVPECSPGLKLPRNPCFHGENLEGICSCRQVEDLLLAASSSESSSSAEFSDFVQAPHCLCIDKLGWLAHPVQRLHSFCTSCVHSLASVANSWLFGDQDTQLYLWNRNCSLNQTTTEFQLIIKMILALLLLSVMTAEDAHLLSTETSV